MLEGVGGLRFHMVFDDLWTPRLSDTPGSQIYNGKQSQQKRAEQGKLNKSILLRHHVSLFHQSFGQHTYIAYLILQDYTMLFATMGRKPSSFCLSRHLRWLTREKEGQCGAVRRRTGLLSPLQSVTTPSYLRRGPEGQFDSSFSLAKRHDAALSQKGPDGQFDGAHLDAHGGISAARAQTG